MKNSQIHNGFSQKEVRNFLAISLIKCFEKLNNEANNKTNIAQPKTNDINPFKWQVYLIKKEIETLQIKLEIAEEQKAIFSLIINNGWEEFDVSDETYNDSKYKLMLNFIGTKKEYEELLNHINLESNSNKVIMGNE